MRIGYDPEGDILFVELGDLTQSAGAVEVAPGAYVDLAQGGAVLNIEVTNASTKYAPETLRAFSVAYDDLLPLAEAAVIAGTTPQALRKACERGRLEGRKVGRNWAVTRASLLAYLDSRQHAGVGRARAIAEAMPMATARAPKS